MPRFKSVNGEKVQLTAAEEAQRDTDEAAWAAEVAAQALKTKGDVAIEKTGDFEAGLIKYLAKALSTSEKAVQDGIKAEIK